MSMVTRGVCVWLGGNENVRVGLSFHSNICIDRYEKRWVNDIFDVDYRAVIFQYYSCYCIKTRDRGFRTYRGETSYYNTHIIILPKALNHTIRGA